MKKKMYKVPATVQLQLTSESILQSSSGTPLTPSNPAPGRRNSVF